MPARRNLRAAMEAGLIANNPRTTGNRRGRGGLLIRSSGVSPATRFREDDMNHITRRAFGAAGFALLLVTSASFAQQPPPVRVRGMVKAALSDIKDNSFIGVTGMPQSDGSQKAVEIHIFPEPMRGTGEGHRPW